MRPTSKVIVSVWVCLLLIGCGKSEPTYQGRPASQWIADAKDKDPNTRRKAIDALGMLGKVTPSVIDALRKVMRTDATWENRDAAAMTLVQIEPSATASVVSDVTAWLKDDDARMRWQGADTLRKIGADAAPALPALRSLVTAESKEDPKGCVAEKANEAVAAIESASGSKR